MLVGGAVAMLGNASFARLAGLARTMPLTSFGIVIGGLGLIGVPGTAGFIGKWYLILAALEQGQWLVVAAILASSLLAVVYVWRFVEHAYFREPVAGTPKGEAPLGLLVPSLFLLAATVWLGFDTSLTVGSATEAARMLLGAGR